jgi:transposase
VTPRPTTDLERELERVQRQMTMGQLAEIRRRELIVHLHGEGMSQVELAARLSRASRQAGGNGVKVSAVEHLVRRWRRRLRG